MPTRRPLVSWKLPEGDITLGARTHVMGLLDLSTDSSAAKPDPVEQLERAERMVDDGADSLLATARSPRQSGPPPSADDELRRLVPTLRKLRSRLGVLTAVTTSSSEAAERVIELGASIIHDPSGLSADPRMARLVNDKRCALILSHARTSADPASPTGPVAMVAETVLNELDGAVARARLAGLDPRTIAIDPGLGMGKQGNDNFELIERLGELHRLGRPVLVIPSGKSFLTESVRAPELDWKIGAVVGAAFAIRAGAHIICGEEVAELAAAARTADRLLSIFDDGLGEEEEEAPQPTRAPRPPRRETAGRPLRPPIRDS